MTTAYLDCFAGVCGSMLLGALVDAGLAPEDLERDLTQIELRDYRLTFEQIETHSLRATRVRVAAHEGHVHRGLGHIEEMLRSSQLPPAVVARACAVFRRLALAEGRVHGLPPDEIHFHEVGAVDAIVDIVGVLLGLERLGIR